MEAEAEAVFGAGAEAGAEAEAEAGVAEPATRDADGQSSDGEDSEIEILANLEQRSRGLDDMRAKVPSPPSLQIDRSAQPTLPFPLACTSAVSSGVVASRRSHSASVPLASRARCRVVPVHQHPLSSRTAL